MITNVLNILFDIAKYNIQYIYVFSTFNTINIIKYKYLYKYIETSVLLSHLY